MRRFPKKKNTYGLKKIDGDLKKAKLERHHVKDITLPIRNTLLLRQYQFSTPEKTMKPKQEEEEVAKNDIVFFNKKKVVREAYQASIDQITVISIEKQTMEVLKTKVVISHQEEDADEASQASADQTTIVSVDEQTMEVAKTKVVISHQEEDVN
ncbi:hypothetical protein GIB67_029396 [Kingdonia uniflora]|uniref:Uncharacterized protein n=1 Tax=Kingdonia uniflora TaxID=39325 RepID=A0A7J7NYI5_9MAGN|nr:hypothetical protein GIB67_029396 [Kingdonia uniflora]